MRVRIGLLAVAAAAALIGSVLIFVYIGRIESGIKSGSKPVEVYVAIKRISKDTSASELISKELIKKVKIPRKYVSDGAVRSLSSLKNKRLAVPLEKGEQLTDSALSATAIGSLEIPLDKMAVSIPVDNLDLINGRIEAGDHVSVLVTLKPGKDGKDVTKILLGRVLIVAVKEGSQDTQGSGDKESNLTVAVTPEEAEKLVFAQEAGVTYIGVWPPGSTSDPKTPGQTLDSLF